MRAERLSWLDTLKGISIVLGAIGHIYTNQSVFYWLYFFHMLLFFSDSVGVQRKNNFNEHKEKNPNHRGSIFVIWPACATMLAIHQEKILRFQ